MKQKTTNCVQLTDDVYWKLAELKLQMRTRSTDEVLVSYGKDCRNEPVDTDQGARRLVCVHCVDTLRRVG